MAGVISFLGAEYLNRARYLEGRQRESHHQQIGPCQTLQWPCVEIVEDGVDIH